MHKTRPEIPDLSDPASERSSYLIDDIWGSGPNSGAAEQPPGRLQIGALFTNLRLGHWGVSRADARAGRPILTSQTLTVFTMCAVATIAFARVVLTEAHIVPAGKTSRSA